MNITKPYYFYMSLMFLTLMFYCGIYINIHQGEDSNSFFQSRFLYVLPRVDSLPKPLNSNPIKTTINPQPITKAINPFQARIINPVLIQINLYSQSASNLLLGTALQESLLGKLSRNVFQIEAQTVEDINRHYLIYHPRLNTLIHDLYNPEHSMKWNLNNNVKYQVAMARLIYLRSDQQLPSATNIDALAWFWKKNYNTILGKGTAHEFELHFKRYFLGYHQLGFTTVNLAPREIYNKGFRRHTLVFNT